MNIWRMKLRAGNHGPDMWPICQSCGIAAITYEPIFKTNLTSLTKNEVDPAVKTAARTSIWRFAWDINGGDVIFIGDSVSQSMIAKGYVSCEPGKRAYRFNNRNPISEPSNSNVRWRHEVPVEWDTDFVPFQYKDKAPRYTVVPFDPSWVRIEEKLIAEANHPAPPARDGRDSPLKYTKQRRYNQRVHARDGRDSPLKYTGGYYNPDGGTARDGRDSPLKYTFSSNIDRSGVARDGRDSPLKYTE